MTYKPEYILCAAIYVGTGKSYPPRRSYAYPETGLVFGGWRHADCLVTFQAWVEALSPEEYTRINEIEPRQLEHPTQGFITSNGRYVSRQEAAQIALRAGQVDRLYDPLMSEDLY